jgi:glutamate dehydrogenase/leucine dehydrogenase
MSEVEAQIMADLFERGDALGPVKVVHVCEPSIGLRAVLVVDNVARGPAVGGLRVAPDVTVDECMRLARAMTLKISAADLAHGSGTSVLWGDPRTPGENTETLAVARVEDAMGYRRFRLMWRCCGGRIRVDCRCVARS